MLFRQQGGGESANFQRKQTLNMMNMKLFKTILTMLLLTVCGATQTWAQDNLVFNYENNLAQLSTTGYKGKTYAYRIGGKTYNNMVMSYPVNSTNVVAFKVPAGTKHLHFHIMGKTSATNPTQFKVTAGGITMMTANMPDISSLSVSQSSGGEVSFGVKPGRDYYKVITFNEPLENTTIIEISTKGKNATFGVFGIFYEDGYSPHKGTLGNPFTASEAYTMAHDQVKVVGKVYVKGRVSTTPVIEDGTASFSISDDATHESEIAVSNTTGLNGNAFSSTRDVLARDEVTLLAEISTPSPIGLYNGQLYKQVQPTYKVFLSENGTGQWFDMQRQSGSSAYLHLYKLPYMTPQITTFHFEEYYGGEFYKAFYGPGQTGEVTTYSWETCDDIQLKAGDGSALTIDPAGEGYFLFLKQVADGPTLDLRGLPRPTFYLCRNGAEPVELQWDAGEYAYYATGIALHSTDQFWIQKGNPADNGPIYGSTTQEGMYINEGNNSDLPAKVGGWNFIMGVTGKFNFKFYVNTQSGEAFLTASPKSGVWPEPRPAYQVEYYNGGNLSGVQLLDDINGGTTYTEQILGFEPNNKIRIVRIFEGTTQYMAPASISAIHRHNSDGIALQTSEEGTFTDVMGDGDLTFTIVETPDGPRLSISGWPDPIYKLSDNSTDFELQDDGTYTTTINVTQGMLESSSDGKYSFDIADVSMTEWVYYGIPIEQSSGLNEDNCQFVQLGGGAGFYNIKLDRIGYHTLTIYPGFALSVALPDRIFNVQVELPESTRIVKNSKFKKNADGSYSANVRLTSAYVDPSTNLCTFRILEGTSVPEVLWGMEGSEPLTRLNSENIDLDAGSAATQMTLPMGEYKMTYYPDGNRLTIRWPMVSVINNGNLEAADMSSFFKVEQGGPMEQATWTAGVGKDGSRGIVVQSRDLESGSAPWDTQFLIRANQTLAAGTHYRIAFDYRASRDGAASESQTHAEPGTYIFYHFPVTPNFTTAWQHYEATGQITREQSLTDNMRTVCMLLAVLPEATTYYFDNIEFEIDPEHVVQQVVMGDVNGDGAVNITDVTTLVDYILGKQPAAFVLEAADIDGDGYINISDVTALVNILLGK